MAKLSAHGQVIGTIYGLTLAYRFMEDGHILKNAGDGWKLHKKLKAGFTPQQQFEAARDKQAANLARRPCYAAYRAMLHDMAGLAKRWKLHHAVELMPNDPDGVWSEACDGYGDNVSADLGEIVDLCRAFRVANMEYERERAETSETNAITM